ncbi:MAG TPA: MFS transporter [Candidatus Mediterraneibacter excrementigallinarum]|nr:MFS transporter [Candidatus Mediterraneibacter excrementigallinarum]
MKRKKGFLTIQVVMLVALSFLLGTSEFIVVGILPEISEGFNISLTAAGAIVSVFAFAYAVGTPFCAASAGKFNRFRFMMVCVLIFAAANLLCGLTSMYLIFGAARIVIAVISGTLVAVSMTFAGDVAAPENMSKVVAGIFSGFSIASVFGVPIATAVTRFLNWRAAFFLIAAASLAVTAVLYKTLPRTGGTEAHSVIRQFVLLRDRKIILGGLCVFFGAAGTYTVYTYLTPIFETELHIPGNLISFALLLFGVAALISNLYSGRLAGNGGMKRMPGIYVVHTLCLLCMPLATRNVATGLVAIFLLGVLIYLVNSPSQMLFLNTASEEYPSCVNLAASFNSVFFNLGIAAGSFLGGLVVDHIGLRYVGAAGAVPAALAGMCAFLLAGILRRRESGKSEKEMRPGAGNRGMRNGIAG